MSNMPPKNPKQKRNVQKGAKPSTKGTSKIEPRSGNTQVPTEIQQSLLTVFNASFRDRLESDIHPLLQEVKGHLYRRDFEAAFGKEEYLEAYAARWTPSRALGYLEVFADLQAHIGQAPTNDLTRLDEPPILRIACIGGGAGAEVVALAGFLNYTSQRGPGDASGDDGRMHVDVIDVADWARVIEKLERNVTTAPELSKYASAAARAASAPLVDTSTFSVKAHQLDVIHQDFSAKLKSLLEGVGFVTVMFTLNELYSTSVPLTQKFLLNLTASLKEGALLLVADSPGSYSTVTPNGAQKKYPIQWLLDHTLLREGDKGESAAWTKVVEDESRWFRIPSGLKYPIELENMRFQLHLYRRGV
ncbi:hypothetical protein BDV96DRAFT_150281 [Lophiotrema nucula]|uniref:25S rRNA (Uridine(2843)-N(3))-methyltransferase n=1 Tax=Lophiotrema nucula TaxID=690887 RepID=A0A6A5Z411_9PLEO|nr:hypothetical protein BDV96DRAFT_150281 [Lophiotrema nucula]